MTAHRALAFLLFSFLTHFTLADTTPEWVRYPAISPDGATIAFTYKGDIYSVSASGGEATRLTFHTAHDYKPVWSSDGTQLAFASARHGNFDVFIMNARGGEASRLTFDSSDEVPYDFRPASGDKPEQVVFKGMRMDTASSRQYPSRIYPELYAVPATGGKVTQIFSHTAEEVNFSRDGRYFVYQDVKGYENPWRKHHRSAVTRDLWLYDTQDNAHSMLTEFAGEDRDPVFSDDDKTLFFLSERNGSFNVYKMPLADENQAAQLTDFDTHPVRFLSYGNGRLAFTHHGQLFTLNEGEAPKPVAISIRTQDTSNRHTFTDVNGEIDTFSISPDGKQLAFIANGDVFVSSIDGGFTKQITDTPETEASVSFSPDGEKLIYAAERGLKWRIYLAEKVRESEPFFYAATLIKESVIVESDEDNYLPAFSPDGKQIAFVEDRRTLKAVNLDGTNVRTLVGKSDMVHFRDGDQYFRWSPDGQYLLFTHVRQLNNADIAVVKADGSEPFQSLSQSAYYDYNGAWVMQGEAILSFSDRHGMRSYATSGRTQVDVYATFLQQKSWDRFRLSKNEFALLEAVEEANKKGKAKTDSEASKSEENEVKDKPKPKQKPVEIDWSGLEDRKARLTIHSSFVDDAVLDKDGKTLYYLTRFEKKLGLWETNLRTKETKKLIALKADRGSLRWDDKHEKLYLLSEGRLSTLDLKAKKSKAIKIKADVKKVGPALYSAAFDHVWLRTQKAFYEPTLHGVDWALMYQAYQPKVAHIDNAHEFAELISEMLGELNVSHAGAVERNSATIKKPDETGRLGLFYDYGYQGSGIKIAEVLAGGPMDKANITVKPGDLITHIDGVALDHSIDWAKLLNHKTKQFTLLTVVDENGDTNQITVTPISTREQRQLLYDRFVERNEKDVLAASKNQLGYVHIPSMSDGPYRTVLDTMLGKHYDKKGMVVDGRFNGGGDLVADLAMFFSGEAFISYETADKVVGNEPTARYTKPVVGLFNESMYSDGHCYASGFVDLKLGTSVGMPVPGTCSFSGWESLSIGVRWGIVPVSAKNKQGEWMENNQMTPDVLIRNQPEKLTQGEDEQLETAIATLLESL